MATEKEYFAFISYQREDEEWAKWLAHELEHYHFPVILNGRKDLPKDLRPIFRDIDELSAGNLPNQIHKALANSKHLIVICSPRSAQSKWVNKEIEEFINMNKTNKIFPFIIDGKAFAENEEECFPLALRNLPKEEERLGGNINEMGRDAAVVKIVAGMLDLDFDTLWQRYEREKAEEERKIKEQRDNLLKVQSRFLSEKANALVDDGDSYTAQLLLLETLPTSEHPDYPYTIETERTLRKSTLYQSAILRGHTDSVNHVEFSPDGAKIVSASSDNRIILWDVDSGGILLIISGHTDSVKSVNFSPDGKYIVSASADKTVKLWDSINGQLLKTLSVFNEGVSDAKFSPNGEFIIATNTSTILWKYKEEEIKAIHSGGSSISFNSNGENFLISYRSGVDLMNKDGSLIKTFKKIGNGFIYKPSFSPDGSKILAPSRAGWIRIWDVDSKTDIPSNTIDNGMGLASYSPNGKYIFASKGNEIQIWDTEKYELKNVLTGRYGENFHSIAFNREGDLLAAICGNHIQLWNILDDHIADKIVRTPFPSDTVFVSKHNKYISSISEDFACWLCTENGNIHKIDKKYDYTSCFSSDDKKILYSTSSKIDIFDTESGELIKTIDNIKKLHTIAAGPNANFIALVQDATMGCIEVWDGCSGKMLYEISDNVLYHIFLCFSPDGKFFLSISYDYVSHHSPSIITFWDTLSGKQLYSIDVPGQLIEDIIFDEDGDSFCYYFNGKIIRRNAQTGSLIQTLESVDAPTCLRFSPNKKTLVSGSEKFLTIWNIEEGDILVKINTNPIIEVFFAPEGDEIGFFDGESLSIIDFPSFDDLIKKTSLRFLNRQLTIEERKTYYLD